MTRKLLSPIKNQNGMIALDFIFAFILVMGFSALIFAVTFTLTVVEATQYITFASARNYFAGGTSQNKGESTSQNEMAKRKYQELTNHPTLAPLFKNGFFEISNEALVGPEILASKPEYDVPGTSTFHGVGTPFKALVLDFEIPFFGRTTNEKTQDQGFVTFIASFLGREPTISECISQGKSRWNRIRALAKSYSENTEADDTGKIYSSITDNGC